MKYHISTSEGKVTQGLTALMKVNFLCANFRFFHPDIEIILDSSIQYAAYPCSKRIKRKGERNEAERHESTLLGFKPMYADKQGFCVL